LNALHINGNWVGLHVRTAVPDPPSAIKQKKSLWGTGSFFIGLIHRYRDERLPKGLRFANEIARR
jgi:hypothetical protein